MPADPRIPVELRIDGDASPGELVHALAALLLERARRVVAGQRADGSIIVSDAQNARSLRPFSTKKTKGA